jgi:hypothetical protein
MPCAPKWEQQEWKEEERGTGYLLSLMFTTSEDRGIHTYTIGYIANIYNKHRSIQGFCIGVIFYFK